MSSLKGKFTKRPRFDFRPSKDRLNLWDYLSRLPNWGKGYMFTKINWKRHRMDISWIISNVDFAKREAWGYLLCKGRVVSSQPIRITKAKYRKPVRTWLMREQKEKGWNVEGFRYNHRWMMAAGPNYLPLPKKGPEGLPQLPLIVAKLKGEEYLMPPKLVPQIKNDDIQIGDQEKQEELEQNLEQLSLLDCKKESKDHIQYSDTQKALEKFPQHINIPSLVSSSIGPKTQIQNSKLYRQIYSDIYSMASNEDYKKQAEILKLKYEVPQGSEELKKLEQLIDQYKKTEQQETHEVLDQLKKLSLQENGQTQSSLTEQEAQNSNEDGAALKTIQQNQKDKKLQIEKQTNLVINKHILNKIPIKISQVTGKNALQLARENPLWKDYSNEQIRQAYNYIDYHFQNMNYTGKSTKFLKAPWHYPKMFEYGMNFKRTVYPKQS